MSKRKPAYKPAKSREVLKTGADMKLSAGLFTIKRNNHSILETDNIEYAKAQMEKGWKHRDEQGNVYEGKAYLYKDNLLIGEISKSGLNIYETISNDAWIKVCHISIGNDSIKDEEDILIPLKEEQVNVSKDTVVDDEVTIRKDKHKENKTVTGEIKHEDVEVEEESAHNDEIDGRNRRNNI